MFGKRPIEIGDRLPLIRARALRRGALVALLSVSPAHGQTWSDGSTTPTIVEVAAVDETGEAGWIYGAEDLAGDGLDTFRQQEQAIDIRTAYASTDTNRFWLRAYVSSSSSPGGNVGLYVFVDADRDVTTGGSAAASDIDERFVDDPTTGGYDYLAAVSGNEMVVGLFEYDSAGDSFVPLTNPETVMSVEVGTDEDPVLINSGTHGYLQMEIDLGAVGLSIACDADLFIRSLNDTGTLGAGDLEVGGRTECGTVDENDDGVPDQLVPRGECAEDNDCPGGGVCIDGSCAIPSFCEEDTDCQEDEECAPDSTCHAAPPGDQTCSTNADCGSLVCTSSDTCGVCTSDSDCEGGRCLGTGYCVDTSDTTDPDDDSGGGGDPDDVLGPGDKIQGGAFSCGMGSRSAPWQSAPLILFATLLMFLRRRRAAETL